MQTSGQGNDLLMILVPVCAAVVVGVLSLGDPAEALDALNNIVREIAHMAVTSLSALL
jgi:hypothetical protein